MMMRVDARGQRDKRLARIAQVRDLRGFSLIELMVTLAVLAVLLAVAVPSFQDVSLATSLRSYANSLVASAQLARSESIKRNKEVTLCMSANGADCTASGSWEQGWIVIDEGGDIVIHSESSVDSGYMILSSVTKIVFKPSGVGTGQATLKVCRATPTVGDQDREVIISATGRTRVNNGSSGTCSSA